MIIALRCFSASQFQYCGRKWVGISGMPRNSAEKSRAVGQRAIKGADKRPLLVNDPLYSFLATLRLVRARRCPTWPALTPSCRGFPLRGYFLLSFLFSSLGNLADAGIRWKFTVLRRIREIHAIVQISRCQLFVRERSFRLIWQFLQLDFRRQRY